MYYDTEEHNVKIELRMRLLRYKIDKIKMAGTSREISSAMDENHDEY